MTAIFDPDFANPNAHHLSHEQAKMRDEAIDEIKLYDLSLTLHKAERYEGTLIIEMKLKNESDIFLDFHGE